MSRWGRPTSVAELIETSLGNVGPFIETLRVTKKSLR
jgi:hypothetical protein